MWESADPVLEKYLPERGQRVQLDPLNLTNEWQSGFDLPGMGGVLASQNLNLYGYSFQNPVRYQDPDGNCVGPYRAPCVAIGRALLRAGKVIYRGVRKLFRRDRDENRPSNNPRDIRPGEYDDVPEAPLSGTRQGVQDFIENETSPSETPGKGGIRERISNRGGGFESAQRDFDRFSPSNVKEIETQWGPGRTGQLEEGQQITVRPGSKTSGKPTLEIRRPSKRGFEVRYDK